MSDLDNPPIQFAPTKEGNLKVTPDMRAVVLRETYGIVSGLRVLYEYLEKGEELPLETLSNILYLSDSRLATIRKQVGMPALDESELQTTQTQIRELNALVSRLREELGKSGTIGQSRAHLQTVAQALETWWNDDGLGYAHEITFSPTGRLTASLSTSLYSGLLDRFSESPVTEAKERQAWLQSLRDRGIAVYRPVSSKDPVVVDCDASRTSLLALMREKLPSVKILAFKSGHQIDSTDLRELREIQISLNRLEELLPDTTEKGSAESTPGQ